jgi:hypothetical protein
MSLGTRTAIPDYLNVARDGGIGLFSYLNILRIAWVELQNKSDAMGFIL